MPNGDPNWAVNELPELEKFFGKISNLLEDFAKEHNLVIERYYHQSPDWTFRFRHPLKGTGFIEIRKSGDENVLIGAGWQVCDYDTCTLYSTRSEQNKVSLKSDVLRRALLDMLTLVLSWKEADLVAGKEGEYHWWKAVSKEGFEKEDQKYTVAKNPTA